MKNKLNDLQISSNKELEHYKKLNQYYILGRTFILFLFFMLVIAGIKIPAIHSYFMIFFFILIGIFTILCIFHNKARKQKEYYLSYLEVIEQYNKRINNQWIDFKDTGIDLIDKNDYILLDLDIVGDKSLFQYLNVARSEGGRRKLLERLSNPKIDDISKYQSTISQLRDNLEFCIKFQVKLRKIKGNLTKQIEVFEEKTKDHKIELMVNIIFSIITITLALLSLFNVLDSAYFSMSAILQLCYALIIDKINKKELSIISSTSQNFRHIYPIFKMIAKEKSENFYLKEIFSTINKGESIINDLNKIYDLNTFRNHFLGYVLSNGLLPLNTYILYAFHKVKENSLEDLKASIECLEMLEALVSLSIIGVCKENICIPVLSNEIELKFDSIQHPLLNEKICISNSFESKDGVNIITGSNMSGKTSFMRTIGMNLILMKAGTYVNAKMFQSSYFKIFTSMRVSDDIEKGISTFYGELLRIKDIIDYKMTDLPFIVFIDEIFKGTNYNDRIFGAKEVIKNISQYNSIVFITTHDFELCDIEDEKIKNYYFEEYYEENKIKFDYKIKNGKCKTTNAKFLMKQLDII